MPPLSWNVFGGHVDSTQVLLQHGAQVNMDFDAPSDSGGTKKVTVYDVLMDTLESNGSASDAQQAKENGMERYWEVRNVTAQMLSPIHQDYMLTFLVYLYSKQIKQILEKHGAKRYAELAASSTDEL
jgi:hypothetical protein